MDIKEIFGLSDEQWAAARPGQVDVILTAGAGSGKTLTLVARYVALLNEGFSPREVVAVTFTEKAAREMRNRVRAALSRMRELESSRVRKTFWAELENQMDAARIGTIHSLCSEILRAHPAEVGIDPQFEVLDEGLAAALRAQTAQDTLAWAMDQPEMESLFENIQVRSLDRLAAFALDRRLDLGHNWGAGLPAEAMQRKGIEPFLQHPEVVDGIDFMREMQAEGSLEGDAGQKLAAQIETLLSVWRRCLEAHKSGDITATTQGLIELKGCMGLTAGRQASLIKASLRGIREVYEQTIQTWLKVPPDESVEAAYAGVGLLLGRLFDQAHQVYRERLDARRALDFDDLEGLALELLQNKDVRRRWQGKIRAVLVDEFQDTNGRQREIVEALSGDRPGALFVVGDERQSIYRFRGADVTVFRQMKEHIRASGGQSLPLQTTYRAHRDLLDAAEDLLEPAMQAESQPSPPYWVTYSGLKANRKQSLSITQEPHLEFILGRAENSQKARETAARALAHRLLELKREGQIQEWQNTALLFRASTNFPVYEDSLEGAGIPYVTVAGRGFYDRPEIRDMLNILRALADPWDDHAMAGLLRSPAFGLSDSALYQLRWSSEGSERSSPRPYYSALAEAVGLDENEQPLAQRAYAFLSRLAPQVDRSPVAELLKTVIDQLDSRAILATARSRLWRNLDKLLEDAHTSRMVSVRAFLEYLNSLQEVGARESEAPPEAAGTLQLMTIHKAKGLEFDLVVIADAGYAHQHRSESAYLLPGIGLSYILDRRDSQPLLYQYMKNLNNRQEAAEEKRLLYVAATRAREKLIINGHIGKYARGWVKDLLQAVDIDLQALSGEAGFRRDIPLPGGQEMTLWLADQASLAEEIAGAGRAPRSAEVEKGMDDPHLSVGSGSRARAPLYEKIEVWRADRGAEPEEPQSPAEGFPESDYRATGLHRPPGEVIGRLVHRALQRWRLPPDPALRALLEAEALRQAMVDANLRREAVSQAIELLARFAAHPLRTEIQGAIARRHEVPFYLIEKDRVGYGWLDLLYQLEDGWYLVDFKTERLNTRFELEGAVEKHRDQIQRYRRAVRSLLGQGVSSACLCFLDYQGGMEVVEM